MAITHIHTLSWTRAGETITKQVTLQSDAEDNREIAVASDATDFEVAWVVDVTQVVGIYMVAGSALTLETNADDATGGQTITLAADKPFVWYAGCGLTNPLTPDIDSLFVTNTGGTATTLYIRLLIDSTV